jgi:hypothetical protein
MQRAVSALVLSIVTVSTGWSRMDDLPRHTLETARVLRENSALLKSIPTYTCLETISREEKAPKQRKPRPLDVVQVDVGVGQSGEI